MADTKTVEDLKKLRDELVERRWKEAYYVGAAHHEERLTALALVHNAIAALDAVIESGRDGPSPL